MQLAHFELLRHHCTGRDGRFQPEPTRDLSLNHLAEKEGFQWHFPDRLTIRCSCYWAICVAGAPASRLGSRPSLAVADGSLEIGVSDRDRRLSHPAGSGSLGSKTLDGPAFIGEACADAPCQRLRRRVGRNPSRPRQASVVPPLCGQLVTSDRLPLAHCQRRPRTTRIGMLRAGHLRPMGPPDCPLSELTDNEPAIARSHG